MTTVALITGATEGIGYQLAKCFARDRRDLVLVARNRDKLQRVASEISASCGVRVITIAQDLSVPEGARRAFDEIHRQAVTVDFLVNNAGVGTYGLFAEADLERELAMMRLNMISLTALTRLFLPEMLRRRSGRILNVASTAAFQPGPLMAVYYATKAYVVSFTEALANELQGSGVSASVLCPGPTRSKFQESAGMGVFGYTCANDVSARDWQIARGGGQWCRGKFFDTFCPLGPCLVTADELRDPQRLAISTTLNGVTVQDWRTDDMIFDVPAIIEFLSGSTTLVPGTVILTGTPHGVGMAARPPRWLRPGDVVTISIEGIGSLTNPVEEERP